jgi:hypothetical protein
VASVVPHDAVWGDARIAASDVSNAKANAKQTLAMLRRTRRRNSGEPEAGLAAPVQPAKHHQMVLFGARGPAKRRPPCSCRVLPLYRTGGGRVTGWSRSPVPSEKHLGQPTLAKPGYRLSQAALAGSSLAASFNRHPAGIPSLTCWTPFTRSSPTCRASMPAPLRGSPCLAAPACRTR